MRAAWMATVTALGAGLLGVSGCPLNKACTAIGCEDQVALKVTGSDGTLPTGLNRVEVASATLNGACSFRFPLDANGSIAASDCPSGIRVLILQQTNCTETTTGGTRSVTCVPIPDKFHEEVSVSGVPASLRVRQFVDGAMVLDELVTPTYRISQPNGPECGPGCRQATADLTLSAPAAVEP